jgi:cell division inhibitor SulA/protein ImuA
LRRLQVAAKSGETLFFLVRPIAAAADPSPAELRLTLRPAETGVRVEVIKRKGPSLTDPLEIELRPAASLVSPHGRLRRAARTGVALETAEA